MAAFSFGTQPATQAQTAPFGGFAFGGASTTAMPSFSSTPFASTSLPGTQTGFGTAMTTTTPSLFGSTMSSFAPASTATSLFPSLGQAAITSAAPPSTGFSFGGFGAPATSTLNFGSNIATTTATSTAATVGLGGVDDIQTASVDGASGATKKDKAIKEALIPNEITVVIESFKKYVKEQKVIREEMSRVSSKNITRVQSQVSALRQQLSIVSNGLQRNASTIAKLKLETTEELKNAEIGQRTKDTVPSLQYENSIPSGYFHNLALGFENQMQSYRQQIELLERHLLSLSQPSTMTPDELTVVVKRLHGAFVTLAAQLQTVHQQVQLQKEQFTAIHKARNSELGNIFENRKGISMKLPTTYLPVPLTLGPSPVVTMPSTVGLAIAAAKSRTQQIQANDMCLGLNTSTLKTGYTGGNFLSSSQPSLASGFNLQNTMTFKPLGQPVLPAFGSTSSLGGGGGFSNESILSPYGSSAQKPFQLQKPPSGNKRGKRWTST